MVAANLKGETIQLMEKRTAIESEMNAIIHRLNHPSPTAPGLTGNLLDSDGFPRTDIDIQSVRSDRRRLSELRNDHKDITDKINQNIEILHSARLAPKSSLPMEPASASAMDVGVTSHDVAVGGMDVDVIFNRPFAIVDEIAENSPAAEDGLQLGDQIVKFGNVEAGDHLLQRLASVAQSNQGDAVAVAVMRRGTTIDLTVTPRTWNGTGLLGCHFRIL